jgi:predicted adenylyl cyclase CyaB
MGTRRTECEVKVEGALDLRALLDRGGELLGQGVQKNYYLAGHKHLRLREEQGQFTLTDKAEDTGQRARIREVASQVLSPQEASRLIKERGIRVLVCKQRTWVRLDGAIIRLDEVEHLGSFVEISA